MKGASRGLEKGFMGASSPSHLRAPPGEGPFKPPLKGTFEGGGSDPAPTFWFSWWIVVLFHREFFCLWQNCLFDVAALMGVPLLTQQQQYCHLTLRKSILSN